MTDESTRDSHRAKEEIRLAGTSRRDVPDGAVCRACQKEPKENLKPMLHRNLKRALVQTRVTNYLPANTRAQYGFEHVLLESTNDRVLLHQVQDRRMTLQNVRAAVFAIVNELRHVAFAIADVRKPFCAVSNGLSLSL